MCMTSHFCSLLLPSAHKKWDKIVSPSAGDNGTAQQIKLWKHRSASFLWRVLELQVLEIFVKVLLGFVLKHFLGIVLGPFCNETNHRKNARLVSGIDCSCVHVGFAGDDIGCNFVSSSQPDSDRL